MTEHRRLDPETLLKRMQKEEEEQRDESGILKIYLGYSAGVGKTYRMLQNAIQLKKSGVDVVIGIVETHRRVETEALLEDFEIIPRSWKDYQGIQIDEMDLDAVLKRKPALVLVDELAHTNAPGSRNSKRYQDIEELIQAGINVATTLNVQHLESVSDIVEQMTGVHVKEIVTDRFFDLADEIELVDIPIEELEKRLQEGKVYIPEKARLAMMEFFKKSNLMGLRELSLRYTARQVGDEILTYMRENAIKSPIPVGSRILVAMSPSESSQKLIRIGHRMAEDLNADWYTVFVESLQFGVLSEEQKLQLSRNSQLAENLGAQTFSLIGDSVAGEIADFAREHNITLILIGFSSRSRLDNLLHGSVVNELIRKVKPVQVMLVDSGKEKNVAQTRKKAPEPLSWLSFLVPTFLVFASALICGQLTRWLEFVNIAMLMLLPVLFAGAFWGKKQGIWASVLSIGLLDFFFVKPYFTFSVEDIRYLPIFAVFFIVGVTTSMLSDLLKWRINRYREQEKFLTTINSFSHNLLKQNSLLESLTAVIQGISGFFKTESVILLPNKDGNVKVSATSEGAVFSESEIGISQWVYQNSKTAGKGTETLSSSHWYFLPLMTGDTTIGVMALLKDAADRRGFSRDELIYLNSFTNIAAITISRALTLSSTMDYLMKSL